MLGVLLVSAAIAYLLTLGPQRANQRGWTILNQIHNQTLSALWPA